MAGIASFLEESGLGRYAERFAGAGIDGLALLRLSDAERAALVRSSPNLHEQDEAADEMLAALIGHLRWRAQGSAAGGGGLAAGGRDAARRERGRAAGALRPERAGAARAAAPLVA